MPSETHAQPANILDSIGNTTLIQLHKVVPPNHAKILAKLEWQNPTGSMKDRMAVAVISRAEADGRLRPSENRASHANASGISYRVQRGSCRNPLPVEARARH